MDALERFAERYRLKIRREECGAPVILGRFGQIYDHGGRSLGVIYMPDPKGERAPQPKKWENRKRWMLAAGFTIHQDCDGEGTALFDPQNPAHAKVAIRVAGVKARRMMSEKQAAGLARANMALAERRKVSPEPSQETLYAV